MTDRAGARLELTRDRILAHRRRAGALDERLPPGPDSLRRAVWAGAQDSVPRSALLSLHARVMGVGPDALDDPSLVQVWGPRYTAYVVAAQDVAVFTRGRLADAGPRRRRAEDHARRLQAFLDGRQMPYGDAGRGVGVNPNALRYAAPTGTVRIRWDGARQPTVWTVPAPEIDPPDARLELARRYLHVLGPATATSFADWAGIPTPVGPATFDALGGSLVPVRTPIGDAWILASDEASFLAPAEPPAPARLLPSGDVLYLLGGADRELLVPEPDRRARLWTPRVWPGAVLVGGEVIGTWRRAEAAVTIEPWRSLSGSERRAVEAEAASLPIPGEAGRIRVAWAG